MRTVVLVLSLLGLLFLAIAGGAYVWWTLADVDIGVHGLIALILGTGFSLILGGGLMGLVFYSSRHGHDDRQHRPPDRPPDRPLAAPGTDRPASDRTL